MYPYTNTKYGSNDKITISNLATTIPTLPSPFAPKPVLDTTIQTMFYLVDKQHKELVNIKS